MPSGWGALPALEALVLPTGALSGGGWGAKRKGRIQGCALSTCRLSRRAVRVPMWAPQHHGPASMDSLRAPAPGSGPEGC